VRVAKPRSSTESSRLVSLHSSAIPERERPGKGQRAQSRTVSVAPPSLTPLRLILLVLPTRAEVPIACSVGQIPLLWAPGSEASFDFGGSAMVAGTLEVLVPRHCSLLLPSSGPDSPPCAVRTASLAPLQTRTSGVDQDFRRERLKHRADELARGPGEDRREAYLGSPASGASHPRGGRSGDGGGGAQEAATEEVTRQVWGDLVCVRVHGRRIRTRPMNSRQLMSVIRRSVRPGFAALAAGKAPPGVPKEAAGEPNAARIVPGLGP
jgi:hypothetical protein